MTTSDPPHDLGEEVDALLAQLRTEEDRHAPLIASAAPAYRQSARNLVHYVALRQHDLRKLQLELGRRGLSSLGRMEGNVAQTLELVRARLGEMQAAPPLAPIPSLVGPTSDQAERLIHEHTAALLGPKPTHRHVSIMVTAPAASEVDDEWMERLLAAGANVLRINAAHEDERAWRHIVETARRIAAARAHPLRIVVDLPGPKLRTAALAEGVRVIRFRPTRDELGRTIRPCAIELHPENVASPSHDALALPRAFIARLRVGDRLELSDARDRTRELVVTHASADTATAEVSRTTYVIPGTEIVARREGEIVARCQPTAVPMRAFRLEVRAGDRFALVRPDHAAPIGVAAIGCTLDAAFTSLRAGERVLFDDGHIESVVEAVEPTHALVRVTYAAGGLARLGAEKGVNLPETALDVPSLGPDDERALAFAVAHADVVGASFVRSATDVRALHRRLAELGAPRLGILLKIETREGFSQLPDILFAALERAPVGVMIARGDLAIETGYERLAELQEEILWLSEAAHLPVVWATQVLDLQTRTGRPSRAEVTDAAMSVRAECVMLNKGPFIAESVALLDDILRRMEQHQYKKRSLYRRLHLRLPDVSRSTDRTTSEPTR